MKIDKYIVSYFFFGLLLGLIFIISGIISLFEVIISFIIYSLVFYSGYFILKKIGKKEEKGFDYFLKIFIYKSTIFIYTIVIIIGAFVYYNNEISPAKMPEYTISNGKKTVIFQAMSHIAKKEFYDNVKQNIINFKTHSGVYFYEGVKPGSKESSNKFDEAIGINFTPDLYKQMSKLYGVTFQDNNKFLGLVNNLDFNIDLTLDEIIKIYDNKTTNKAKKNDTQIVNLSNEIVNQLNQLNNNELKVLVYINQAILNFIIKNNTNIKDIIPNIGNPDLFDVILNERNEHLAKAITESKYNKIYITYGLLHFDGVYKLLNNNKPNWQIIKVNYLYPIK